MIPGEKAEKVGKQVINEFSVTKNVFREFMYVY